MPKRYALIALLTALTLDVKAIADTDAEQSVASYVADAQSRIQHAWRVPGNLKQSGNLVVRVEIARNGALSKEKIVKGSGDPKVDQSALEAIKATGAVASLPASIKDPANLELTFDLSLAANSALNQVRQKLCTEGAVAAADGKWDLAIAKYQQCLLNDPGYRLAQRRLQDLWFNRASACQNNPEQALRYVRESIFIERNATAVTLLNSLIRSIGKDPTAFNDRIAMAEQAMKGGHKTGAIVEYREALRIKDDVAARNCLMALDKSSKQIAERP